MSPIVCPMNNVAFEPQNAPGRYSAIAEGEAVIGTMTIITSAWPSPKVHGACIQHMGPAIAVDTYNQM